MPSKPLVSSLATDDETAEPSYPGALPPERVSAVESIGVRLNILEWGDPAAHPLVLCHGMWDHARSFGVLGPLLARRFRVLAVDARGHGDSDWASAYSWPTDVLDIVNVLRWIGQPVYVVGHSKGGGQATDAAILAGDLVTKVVNIDGFGPPQFESDPAFIPKQFAEYLNLRRKAAHRPTWRPYKTLDELITRRRSQNPRLPSDWLRYFIFHGARFDHDGWRWKADPHMGQGFGPWRPDWIGLSYATLRIPMLAIVGSEKDTWGPLPPEILSRRLAGVKRLEHRTIDGAGHFVHIERPVETANAILEFLDS